jgi:hypothetical protein
VLNFPSQGRCLQAALISCYQIVQTRSAVKEESNSRTLGL